LEFFENLVLKIKNHLLGIKKALAWNQKPYARGFEIMGSKTKLLGIKKTLCLESKGPCSESKTLC
jgi:hypothetical protein